MKENKKCYQADFKRNAVMLSFEKDTIDNVALKMKISNRTLLHWRKSYIIFGDDFTSLGKIKLTPEQEKIYTLEMKIRKLDAEYRIIKGAEDFLHKGLLFKYQYIAEKEENHSSYLLCRILGVHLGSYKKWKGEYVSERQKWKIMIKKEIASIFLLSKKRYGYKRITAELQGLGYQISPTTVRLYMRELNISVSVKKYKTKS